MSVLPGTKTSDDFPNRPIRIIVPQAAGSGVDLQARVLAQKMGELWGQQGVIENRPGANAIIGMEAGAKATPDGYTLIYAPVSALTGNQFNPARCQRSSVVGLMIFSASSTSGANG